MDWPAIIEKFGLPLAGLAGFGWAIITGKLVPGPTHADVKAQRDKALDLVYEVAQGLKRTAIPVERDDNGNGRPK